MPSRKSDVGIEVVRQIHAALQVDDEWSAWNGRGFSWWPQDVRQRVWASTGFDDHGHHIFRVYAASDAVQRPRLEPADVNRILAELNTLAIGSALVRDPEDGRVRLWSSVTVHAQTVGWVGRLMAAYTILQAVEAQRCAEMFAELLEGEVDRSEHPRSGERETPDGMLDVLDGVFRPAGAGASPWSGSAEFATLLHTLEQAGHVCTGDENGLTAEFPFGEQMSPVQAFPLGRQTSLMQIVADQPHPWIGSGVAMYLKLPLQGKAEDAAAVADTLNRAEVANASSSHFLGSWCSKESGDGHLPAFAAFLPATLHQPGLLTNMAMSSIGRAVWARRFLDHSSD